MPLVCCHHLYMNENLFFIDTTISLIWKVINSNTFHWSLSIYSPIWLCISIPFFCWAFLHIFKLFYSFCWVITEIIISSLLTIHWTNNHDMSKMKWQFLNCGNVKKFMKDIHNLLVSNKTFLHHNSYSLVFFLYIITELTRVIIFKWS